MTGPVTTVGVAVLPPSPTPQHPAHDFTLSIGEIKVFLPDYDIHVNNSSLILIHVSEYSFNMRCIRT